MAWRFLAARLMIEKLRFGGAESGAGGGGTINNSVFSVGFLEDTNIMCFLNTLCKHS